MKIDLSREGAEYDKAHDALVEKYGNATNIPKDEDFMLRERLRAAYCLSLGQGSVVETLKHYSVDERVWKHFISGEVTDDASKRIKRGDKQQMLLSWTKEHTYEEVTPQILMDVADVSYPTVIKFINDRPDIFRKVKRGVYEVRDPKVDREVGV